MGGSIGHSSHDARYEERGEARICTPTSPDMQAALRKALCLRSTKSI